MYNTGEPSTNPEHYKSTTTTSLRSPTFFCGLKMGLNQVLLLAHVFLYHITFGSEVVVQVNTKKWMYYVPERFLSLTIDPLTLAAASPLTKESFNMAKGLTPSFVRLGGIGTNALYFGKKFMENSTTVSESQWDSVNEFARDTGLDIIASLNPTDRTDGVWDSRNSNELISYSAKKRYGVAWQLGYDMRGYNASGAQVGRDLVKLRKLLDGLPSYANLPVFGPDVTSVNGAKQIHFVKDLITKAGSPLACLVLRPNFKNDNQPEDSYDLMASMTNELDMYVWNKDARVGKSIAKKPVWIAEPTPSQGSFEETVKFVKRLGHAARLGVQIYLRQTGLATLKSPTPDYWFSLLYKNLVGQGVLDYKMISQNQTGLNVFSHCTAAIPQDKSVLDTDWNYEKGAVTMFGVNESPEPTKLVLKVTNKEEPIHIYTLTTAKKNVLSADDIVTTLLNGQELKLSPSGELPVLSPKVKKPSKSNAVTIPGGSIFFVVVPDSKVRTCSIAPLAAPDLNLSELTKRLRLGSQKKAEESEGDKEDDEESPSEESVYVSFSKKRSVKPPKDLEPIPKPDALGKTLMRTIISKLTPKKIDLKMEADKEEMPVKYITFNENSFLNKLAEGVREEIDGSIAESENSKENKKSRVEYKYPALVSALKASKHDSEVDTDVTPSSSDDEPLSAPISVSIQPLALENSEKPLSRSRRSSKEDSLAANQSGSESIKLIESIMDAKKKGKPLNGKMADVTENLSMHDVTWKLAPDDPEEKARSARQASLEPSGKPGDGFLEENAHESLKSPQMQPAEEEDHKLRNVRHASDSVEKQEDSTKTEDPTKEMEIETLSKIVEKTEQVSSVSESPQGIIVPEEVPEEKLNDMMLKAAKSTSDPEPDGNPSKDEPGDPMIIITPETKKPEEKSDSLPIMILPSQLQNAPLIGQPGNQNSPVPGQFNPMLVPTPPNPGMVNERGDPMVQPGVQSPPLPNTEDNNAPIMNPLTPPVIQEGSFYNEQKEKAIDTILEKIANGQGSELASIQSDGLKQGMVADLSPSAVVPINVAGDTVLIAPDDLKTLKETESSNLNVQQKSADDVGIQAGRAAQTLADSGQNLDLAGETGAQDMPSVKIPRQVKVKIRLPVTASATPKSATATLAAPLEEPSPTTPTSGPVSPFPSSKEMKPPSSNQLKPPSPEELKERYKALREKMLELRQQYLEARDRKLEEFRKQVAVARTTPDEETIKSTIKRREAELKDWFKKFDKRESDPTAILKPGIAKSRPRRLTVFTNDEELDMEKFFEEDPVDSYNYKRSPEIASPPQQHISPNPVEAPKPENTGKLLIPLDSKTPQGIVYNNRIYPARLFGYIDPKNHYGEFKEATNVDGTAGQYRVRENFDASPPIARERLAYIPKDAFIKEFKSDFVPVVLIDPQVPDSARTRRSLRRHKRSASERTRRSTLVDLEEQFHRVKDEIFPKITSWIKNIRENPPWKRDLERSSRTKRSVHDMLLTNDLRSLKLHPKILPTLHQEALPNGPKIEDFILKNIEKGENDVLGVAKKMTGMAEKIDQTLFNNPSTDNNENGYCEEIATSGKSVIKDPFEKSESDSSTDSEQSKSKILTLNDTENEKSAKNPLNLLKTEQNPMKVRISGKLNEETDGIAEETMLANVADKIRDFLTNMQSFFGVSDR